MQETEVTIINKLGLHARAAARLVNTAGAFGAEIILSRNGQEVNGKSIMGVMMLAAARGSTVRIRTAGEDEQAAIQALVELVNDRFGEAE